jgi:hypothetical protein
MISSQLRQKRKLRFSTPRRNRDDVCGGRRRWSAKLRFIVPAGFKLALAGS